MMDLPSERKRDEEAKFQFLLTGFTQNAGIRKYSFDGRVETRKVGYTVDVELALLPVYGIRIQDLPLMCRELLQQRPQPDEVTAHVFTEQRMRSHAEKITLAREEAERKKKSKRAESEAAQSSYQAPLR
jgi:hypothetical protein